MDALRSAIYKGWVSHRRFSPKKHAFRYRVFMMYVCLRELDDVLGRSMFWSTKKFSIARFKREDFHGDPRLNLDEAVRRTIETELGFRPNGDICVLANFRYFGFNMNPLCTYYCYDECGENIEAILAEVTNTPWNERRAYALDCREGDCRENVCRNAKGHAKQKRSHASKNKTWYSNAFQKDFTVSPFNPLDMQYLWRSSTPSKRLNIHIENWCNEEKVTDATLRMEREEITSASLAKIVVHFPLMTAKVALAIYWQALLLVLKGVPFLGKDKLSNGQKHNKSGSKSARPKVKAETFDLPSTLAKKKV